MADIKVFSRRLRSAQLGPLALIGVTLTLVAGLLTACGKTPITSAQAQETYVASRQGLQRSTPLSQIHLTIVAQKPGSAVDGPSYTPTTNLTLPANTVVTFTIVNTDLGDTPLPAGSPFNSVSGVLGGTAQVDGVTYSALALDKVAHTFTLPGLGINVPIPGDAPAGHEGVTVTFSIRTHEPGVYRWQCMAPCGSDPAGFGGPMTVTGYMMGTLSVVG